MDFELWEHFGANLELAHAHQLGGRPGALRLMGYWNRARMAAFRDAPTDVVLADVNKEAGEAVAATALICYALFAAVIWRLQDRRAGTQAA